MQTRTYRDLLFWQRALEVTKLVFRLVAKLPQTKAITLIISQVLRSSMSVGANVAEGYGRHEGKEYTRFLQMALGSANETEYWLILLKEVTSFREEIDLIIEKNTESIKMIAKSIYTLRSKLKARK